MLKKLFVKIWTATENLTKTFKVGLGPDPGAVHSAHLVKKYQDCEPNSYKLLG